MLIQKAKNYLKTDKTFQDICAKYKVSPQIIDLIPIRFGDLPVSARTAQGIITLNYKLLNTDNFFNNIHYLHHELDHAIKQTQSSHPTQSADDGNYLDNPDEQEAFQYQLQFLDDLYGPAEAHQYVNHLLDHHDIKNKKDRKNKKQELLKKVK